MYYLIRANAELQQCLASVKEDWTILLSEPRLWSDHGRSEDDSRMTLEYYYPVAMLDVIPKILFQLDLIADYLPATQEPENDFQRFLIDLIEYPPVRLETFDKWWTLERFDSLDNTLADVTSELTRPLIDSIQVPSAPGAREWIESLLEHQYESD